MIFKTSRGMPFTVSPEDADRVSQHRWHTTTYGYIATNMKTDTGYQHVRLHRWLMGVVDDRLFVDHVDGDPANNRRNNLRVCTRRQNAANQKKRRGSRSIFKGVTFESGKRKGWRASVRGRPIGSFLTEMEAAAAYDRVARETYGEFARLNLANGVFA